MIVCAFAAAPECQALETGARSDAERETVVLLHGLGRTQLSMLPLARALEREGFRVVNLTYRSRTRSLEDLATRWLPDELQKVAPTPV